MHVSAVSPGVRPPGTLGNLSKTPNKTYLIPWGMGQEKVIKFPHPQVPKEVRERTIHVKLWKTLFLTAKVTNIFVHFLCSCFGDLHAWTMISVLAMSIYSIHYNPFLIIQLQHDVWLVFYIKCIFDCCSEIFCDHNNNSSLSILNKHLRKQLKGKE